MTEIGTATAGGRRPRPRLAAAARRGRLAAPRDDRPRPGPPRDRASSWRRSRPRSWSLPSSRRRSPRSCWTLRDRGWSRIKAAAAVFLGAAAGHHRDPGHHRASPSCRTSRKSVHDADALASPTLQATAGRLSRPARVGFAIDRRERRPGAGSPASAHAVAGMSARLATVGLLATFLTFFFMMDGDKAWVWVLSSANTWRRDAITTSGHVALERVGGYLRGTAVIAAFDGARRGPLPGAPRGPARRVRSRSSSSSVGSSRTSAAWSRRSSCCS